MMVDWQNREINQDSILATLSREIVARFKLPIICADVQFNSRGWQEFMDVRFTLKGGKTVDASHRITYSHE